MHVRHLTLRDFRSYASLDVELGPGPTAFVGRNGQGKTNLVEAVDYLAHLGSHRVASDAPLVRRGAEAALVRAAVERDGRLATLEVEIIPGRSNRARVNRNALPRSRDLVGLLRTVVFSPEDLALVKGDPGERRRFLDDLMTLRTPRLAGVRADYERVLKQRASLLKTARGVRRGTGRGAGRGTPDENLESTLAVWDERLCSLGAEILEARLLLLAALQPYAQSAYAAVALGVARDDLVLGHRASVELGEHGDVSGETEPRPGRRAELEARLQSGLAARRDEELERAQNLVGPHRDDMSLELGDLPVKGYASHGESWSVALALRLASYELLRADGDDPILVLDDVFAELDAGRRDQLAALVADAEQVLVTAAVEADVPQSLAGARFVVEDGEVQGEHDPAVGPGGADEPASGD
ncbi:DNA replication/repair protein RecF [Nocardioidaceae bacterium]|nr:DNA replication/repair protein RecF [Nocardioidaceae bacterium]